MDAVLSTYAQALEVTTVGVSVAEISTPESW